MIISMSRAGISVTFRCKRPKYASFFSRCPDKSTENCLKCEYCRADMSAPDAMKLLNTYQKVLFERRSKDE